MNLLRPLAFAVSVALLNGCGGSDDNYREERVQVASNLAVCHGLQSFLCYRTRTDDSAPWRLQFEPIDGFTYEWGRQYVLRVGVRESRGSGMADAPSVDRKVSLLAVESSQRVPAATTYRLRVPYPQQALAKAGDGSWRLLGLPLACAQIQARFDAAATSELQLDHSNSPAGPLNVLGATAASPP
jgi:hypothetical protein